MSADKRTVSTDALETLGTVIDDTQKRDAIHLAVIPVQATSKVYPSQHVDAKGNPIPPAAKDLIGIVDPFLDGPVYPGQWFWLVIYPRKITSLRHVWSHPAFDEEAVVAIATTPTYDPPPIKPATYGTYDAGGNMVDESSETAPLTKAQKKALKTAHRRWIENYAEEIGLDYEELMDGAHNFLEYGDYLVKGGELEGVYLSETFWDQYERVTGVTVPDSKRYSFFSCSC